MPRRSTGTGGLLVLGFFVVLAAMCRGGGGAQVDDVAHSAPPDTPSSSTALLSPPVAETGEPYFVSTKSLNQRSSPNGPVVGRLVGGDAVVVYERDGEWARVSKGDASARWVSTKLLCTGAGCYTPRSRPAPPTKSYTPPRNNFDRGACSCSGRQVCIGPRGGRYCITSGGNKRYGV